MHCCSLGLDKFEFVQNVLKEKGLIRGKESEICKPNGPFSHCTLCAITQVCAVKVMNILIILIINNEIYLIFRTRLQELLKRLLRPLTQTHSTKLVVETRYVIILMVETKRIDIYMKSHATESILPLQTFN
jgi:hypothetical protein